MKIAYASRTGNVESLISSLGITDATQIKDGSEMMSEDFILFTYTDGYGDVPSEVDTFLMGNSPYLKGVVASGDTSYGEAYCASADKIAELYGVDILGKIENAGTPEEIEVLKSKLSL